MRLIFAVVLAFVISSSAFSQQKFVPGFIVKNSGDTIKGLIKQGAEASLYKTVPFKTSDSAEAVDYTVNNIVSFGFDGGNSFEKIQYADPVLNQLPIVFGKHLVKGYNNLYSVLQDERQAFIVKSHDGTAHFLYDDVYASAKNSAATGSYKPVLYELGRTCGQALPNISTLPYNQGSIIDFVTQLNQCVSPSTANTVLYKQEKTTFRVYAFAGGMSLGKSSEFSGRVIGRFTIPSVDTKFSINAGISFSSHTAKDSLLSYFVVRQQKLVNTDIAIPVTVQYNFTSGIIQPYVAGGLYMVYDKQDGKLGPLGTPQSSSKFTPYFLVAAGLECPVTQQLLIKADWQFDIINHCPVVGLAYFFN